MVSLAKKAEFKDTATPIGAAQMGGAHALHRGGGANRTDGGHEIIVASAQENAGRGPFSVQSTGGKSSKTPGSGSRDIFGKKKSGKKSDKIEYGSTLKNISTSGYKISKGNFKPSTPGVKIANILNPERYATANPMSARNKAIPNVPRPALSVPNAAPPTSLALRAARTNAASRVPMAQPTRAQQPALGGPVST